MELPELFKSLKLDVWYKAFVYLGGVLFMVALLCNIKALTNEQLMLLAAGMFLIGVGEWKNHKVESWIKPANAYTGGSALMSRTVRSPDALGRLFDFAGVVLLVLFIRAMVSKTCASSRDATQSLREM